jgi:hypothetical protein
LKWTLHFSKISVHSKFTETFSNMYTRFSYTGLTSERNRRLLIYKFLMLLTPWSSLSSFFTLAYLDIGHVFREALIFLADLKSQLPSVTHHQHRYLKKETHRDKHTVHIYPFFIPTGKVSQKHTWQIINDFILRFTSLSLRLLPNIPLVIKDDRVQKLSKHWVAGPGTHFHFIPNQKYISPQPPQIYLPSNWLQLLQCGQYKHCCLSHAWLGLAQDIHSQNGLRDALMLD